MATEVQSRLSRVFGWSGFPRVERWRHHSEDDFTYTDDKYVVDCVIIDAAASPSVCPHLTAIIFFTRCLAVTTCFSFFFLGFSLSLFSFPLQDCSNYLFWHSFRITVICTKPSFSLWIFRFDWKLISAGACVWKTLNDYWKPIVKGNK